MRFKIILSLLVLACMGLAACSNTVEGAGKDISKAGQKIEKSVQ